MSGYSDVFGGGSESRDLSVDGGLVGGLDVGMGADGWTAGRQAKNVSTSLAAARMTHDIFNRGAYLPAEDGGRQTNSSIV